MLKVLVIDDQPAVRTALETLLAVHGLEAVSVGTPDEALHLLATEDIGAVLQDMNFAHQNTDGAEGMKLFRDVRALDPDMPILLMTAWTALESAVALIKEGRPTTSPSPGTTTSWSTRSGTWSRCGRCDRRTRGCAPRAIEPVGPSPTRTTSVARSTRARRCTRPFAWR